MSPLRSALLGIDLGTTSIKAAAFSTDGELLASARRPTPVTRLPNGWLEHDAEEFVAASFEVMREASDGLRVEGIGAAGMGEAGTVVGRNGRALRPLIAWYDTRGAAHAQWWEREVGAARIYQLTGQTLDPNLGANKLLWVRENEPELFARAGKWLSATDLVVTALTGRAATDFTIGSRTMLLDREQRDWSDELLGAAGLERELLPEAAVAGTRVGGLAPEASAATGIAIGTPVSLGGHDHLCAAFAVREHDRPAVDSTGTAEGLVAPLGAPPAGDPGVSAHVSCYPDVVPGGYVLSAQVGLAGGLVEWLGREAYRDAAGNYERMLAEIRTPLRFTGVVCHPVFGRGASPWWDPDGARGAYLGLTLAHTRGDLLQAALEASCFSLRANIEWFAREAGISTTVLRSVGGATRNEIWMQLKADVTGLPVEAVTLDDAAALGVALLAGVGAGVYTDHATAAVAVAPPIRRAEPDPERAELYSRVYEEVYARLPDTISDLQSTLRRLADRKE